MRGYTRLITVTSTTGVGVIRLNKIEQLPAPFTDASRTGNTPSLVFQHPPVVREACRKPVLH